MTKITVPIRLLKICDTSNRGFIEEWRILQAEEITPEEAYEQLEELRERYGLQRRYTSYKSFLNVMSKRYRVLRSAGKLHLL